MAEPDSAVPLAAELPGPRAHSNLRVQRLSGIGGLRVTGEIDMHTHSAWDDVLAELPTDGTPARLDLSGLSFIDVRGVAALTTAALRMPPDIQRDPVAGRQRPPAGRPTDSPKRRASAARSRGPCWDAWHRTAAPANNAGTAPHPGPAGPRVVQPCQHTHLKHRRPRHATSST